MCIKCSSVTRTKCLIVMYKVLRSEILKNFRPLIKTWPIWINMFIYFHKWKHKIWSKFTSFDMRKKGNLTHFKLYEEKGEFGNPRNESLGFKWDTLIMFGPLIVLLPKPPPMKYVVTVIIIFILSSI